MQIISRWMAAAFLIVGGVAQAQQTTLLDEVRTVGAAGAAVPVELSVDIVSAGNYEVVLTDLGAQSGAALGPVRLGVTRGGTLLTPELSAPGTLPFTAVAASSYTIRVTGSPGAGIGSGLIRIDVRAAGSTTSLETFVAMLAPPPGEPAAGLFLLDTPLTVPNTGSYDVTLRDLQLPQALPTDSLLLAVVEEGGPLVTQLSIATGNPVSQTVTLDSSRQYHVFSIAVPATPTSGGLYTFDVSPTGGGAAALSRTVPVGGAVLLGSINLAAGAHTLALRDLAFPVALSAAVVDVVQSGQLIAQAPAVGDVAFTATAGPHEIYAFGVAANGEIGGSLNAAISPTGQPAAFSAAHVFAAPDAQAFTYEAGIANAANFRVRLADYQFPAAFQALRLAAVQDGAIVGTRIVGAGSTDIAALQGKLTLLAVARGATGGSLFGVDVTPTALGAVAFETTQGLGGTFVSRKLSVNNSMSFDVRVSDLAFPGAFANLSTAVTRGSERVGIIFGGGTFPFTATPGNYFLNLIAVPGANQTAGTYAVSVTERPPPPVVTLAATPAAVTGSGGAVDLTWSSQAATSCAASGGWSGAKPVSGTERTQNITAATTFTLACSGAGGTTTQSVTVNVIADPPAGGGGGGGGAFDALWLALLSACVFVTCLLRRRGGAALLTALVALLALGGCGGAQSRYTRSMERGQEFLEAGDLEKARVEFRNAMQISPQSAEARYQTGVVAQRARRFPRSAAIVQVGYRHQIRLSGGAGGTGTHLPAGQCAGTCAGNHHSRSHAPSRRRGPAGGARHGLRADQTTRRGARRRGTGARARSRRRGRGGAAGFAAARGQRTPCRDRRAGNRAEGVAEVHRPAARTRQSADRGGEYGRCRSAARGSREAAAAASWRCATSSPTSTCECRSRTRRRRRWKALSRPRRKTTSPSWCSPTFSPRIARVKLARRSCAR